MAATNIRDFMFRPSASVRRSSDALRQRDGRSAAQPYKAEKQGIGRRAFRAGSQSRIAMLYFFRLKIPNCVGQLGILVAQFLKLLIIVPVDLGFDRGCAGHSASGPIAAVTAPSAKPARSHSGASSVGRTPRRVIIRSK